MDHQEQVCQPSCSCSLPARRCLPEEDIPAQAFREPLDGDDFPSLAYGTDSQEGPIDEADAVCPPRTSVGQVRNLYRLATLSTAQLRQRHWRRGEERVAHSCFYSLRNKLSSMTDQLSKPTCCPNQMVRRIGPLEYDPWYLAVHLQVCKRNFISPLR